MKEENKKELLSLTPDYLEKHKLWDSYWLMKKYPERFKNNE